MVQFTVSHGNLDTSRYDDLGRHTIFEVIIRG